MFDPVRPRCLAKTNYLMPQVDQRLAALANRFNSKTQTVPTNHDGGAVESDRPTQTGRRRAEDFMANYFASGLGARPDITVSPGHSFSDLDGYVISLVNLESVQDLSQTVGADLNPLRSGIMSILRV